MNSDSEYADDNLLWNLLGTLKNESLSEGLNSNLNMK